MRPLQLAVAACLGAMFALVVVARRQEAAPRAPVVAFANVRQDVIDYHCYSCGSGSGPSAPELVGLLHLTGDEAVVHHDAGWNGAFQFHGQFHDYLIASSRGVRRAVVLLH